MLVGAYNWWPLGAARDADAARSRRCGCGSTRARRGAARTRPPRSCSPALATLAPIVMTLAARHESPPDQRRHPPTPWWLFFASALAFIAVIALRQVLTGDRLTTFVFGVPAVFGTLGVIGVYWYEVSQPRRRGELLRREARRRGRLRCRLVGLALFLADALVAGCPAPASVAVAVRDRRLRRRR